MEDKKDIGSFFKDRLSKGKRSPNKNIWDKINASLYEVAPSKKSNLHYWIGGLGIPVLLGLFLLFNPSEDNRHSEIPEGNNSTKLPFSTLEKTTTEDNPTISVIDSLESIKNPEEKLVEITTNIENPTKIVAENSSEIVQENKIKKSSVKSSSVEETFTVTRKYHYYNSKNDEQWTTTDKTKIDSLLSEENKILDSTVTKKKGSLIE